MGAALDQIEKRHAERRAISKSAKMMTGPVLTDTESVKLAKNVLNELQSKFLNACFLVERDVQVLLAALVRAVDDVNAGKKKGEKQAHPGDYVEEVGSKIRLTDEEVEVINARRLAEIEAEEKALKKISEAGKAMKDVPGQLKLVKDDGSIAEAAGPCETVS